MSFGADRLLRSFARVAVVVLGGSCSSEATARAQDAELRVENLRFAVAESGAVRILFDLVGDDPQQPVGIHVLVSQDGGQTYALTAVSVSGDAGPAVLPGRGKTILWESARDVERLDPDRLRFRVVVTIMATPREPPSRWGVVVSYVPDWRITSGLGRALLGAQSSGYRGQELRAGIVRGRSESGDWGVSLVLKRLRGGATLSRETPLGIVGNIPSTFTFTAVESLWQTGAELHTFVPLARLGAHGQMGVVVGAGMSWRYSGRAEQRVEGPILANDPFSGRPLVVVSTGPGFLIDSGGNAVSVPPRQTFAVTGATARELYRLSGWDITPQVIGRAELAAAFNVRPGLKVRLSGGFNLPGFQVVTAEVIQWFGGGSPPR